MKILDFLKLTEEEQKKYLRDRIDQILALGKEAKLGYFDRNYTEHRKVLNFSTYYGRRLIKGKRGEGPDLVTISRRDDKDGALFIDFFDIFWERGKGIRYMFLLRITFVPSIDGLIVVGRSEESINNMSVFKNTREYIKARGWVL